MQIVFEAESVAVHPVLQGRHFFVGLRQWIGVTSLRVEYIPGVLTIGVAKADHSSVLIPAQHVRRSRQYRIEGPWTSGESEGYALSQWTGRSVMSQVGDGHRRSTSD
jgi:hypothetical protein